MNKPTARKLGALTAALMLSGCVATKVDLAKFRESSLKEAEIMPTKAQLERLRTKIVVFEADDAAANHIRNAGLGLTLSSTVEKELAVSGAEIIDRSIANKLGDELRLAESRGSGSYQGPDVAQFAIRGKISSAEYGAKFNEATSYTDKKTGKTSTSPSSYSHSAGVVGSINVYELPSLRLVSSIKMNGKASANDPKQNANVQIGAALLRKATESAVEDSSHELKNLFAPKGYVVEKRVDGDKNIFKILMGRDQGVKTEDKVVIYSLRRKTNALTGVESVEEVPVAEATVSEHISNDESWASLADKQAAGKIRLGDFVKVKYSEASFLQKALKNALK